MLSQNHFEITETIYESDNSTIYKAREKKSGKEVVLKQGKGAANAGLYNEYKLYLEQSGDYTDVELTEYSQLPALVRQYFTGTSLRFVIDNLNSFGVDFFFRYCFLIIDELKKIHKNGIIHKDISPDNILLDPEENKVHIIDFELGTQQQYQQTNYKGASVIEGTLHYISPEQTGRMNRVIDYRADIYSLGVIFYEMLSGTKPFDNEDALELIHCHIALLPKPLSSHNPQIPEILTKIVEKLMAKNAEDRYQSLVGLRIDLEHCHAEWQKNRKMEPFELGKGDMPVRLNVSQKLVGRKAEIDKIFELFEQSAQGKKVLLEVKGMSGVGKTMLIKETARPLTAHKGTYISGKFDSLQRNVPYYAWAQALNQLADLLLTENDETVENARKFLEENLQGLEADIIAIAPRWKKVMGEVKPLPLLAPKEQQNRIQFAISQFLKSVLKVTKPLLFFVDDWQWADEASIELLKSLSSDSDLKSLYLAIAYRNNEVDNTHPFQMALDFIYEEQRGSQTDSNLLLDSIELNPLTRENVIEILSETFTQKGVEVNEFGELIYSKTQGNPFFINQLLDFLYTKKHIWLDGTTYAWKWNLSAIKELAVTENIAAVIINKINDISPQSLEILTIASCLGNIFSLSSLEHVTGLKEKDLHQLLWEAVKENIIQPLDADYKYVPEYYEENNLNLKFKFSHDRIQQALYNLTEPDARKNYHFKASEYDIQNQDEIDNLFITANHLVSSGDLLQKSTIKEKAAALLLEAGKKAFASAAYESALIFLSLKEELKSDKSAIEAETWGLLIQSAYMNFEEEKAAAYETKAFSVIKTKDEKVKVYESILKGKIAINKLNEAVSLAKKVFAELGFKMPKGVATKFQTITAAIATQIALPTKQLSKIGEFPEMTDPDAKALMRLMYISLAGFFFVERDSYPLIIFKMVRMSKKFGNTDESIIGYGSYGLVLAGVMNNPEAGYQTGKEAMKLFRKFNAPQLEATAGFVDTMFIAHWKESIYTFEDKCLKYFEKGLNTGNLEYAAWNIYTHSNLLFFRGIAMSELIETLTNYEKFYLRHKQMNVYQASPIIRNSMMKLNQKAPISLIDNEEEFRLATQQKEANNTVFLFVYYLMKIYLGLLNRKYAEVLEFVEKANPLMSTSVGNYWLPFYKAIKACLYVNNAFEGNLDYKKIQKQIKTELKSLEKANAFFDGNLGWIVDLMQAEMKTFETQTVQHSLYDSAKQKAEKNRFAMPVALIEQMRLQKMKYLHQDGCKELWEDVKQKFENLEIYSVSFAWESDYPDLKTYKAMNVKISQNRGEFTAEQFDIKTIIKTTEILSGEIVLDKLIGKMMQFAMENAGARYGAFMVRKDGKYEMTAERYADDNEQNRSSNGGIPQSVFNYVIRTKDSLILDSAIETSPYNNDPKILALNEKSVMCIPIIHQNECIGVLYLANQLSSAVFTDERVGLLKMLAGQMGVSLQNAILYENMEKLVEKRTEQLALEMEKTDSLLLNILPREVATELKESGKATPRYYENATVMFCDIKDFTKRAETLSAVELIEELDMCFKAFDEIIAKHKIEKIKTIGDAYLCVGGIPTYDSNHALNTVNAAIEIQRWMQSTAEKRQAEGKDFFKLRIGIHSGPVVAGVVGSSKFAYDIWGDTVNTAARMEQGSETGRINISQSVYELVGEQAECHFRGEIEAKNKGMLKMYFVEY